MKKIFDKIYIEKSQKNSFIAKNIIKSHGTELVTWISNDPEKKINSINRHSIGRDIMCERDPYPTGKKTLIITGDTPDYNAREKGLGLGGFFNQCPGTPGLLCCNYYVINPVMGCNFDCQYCFLQGYLDSPAIVVYGNILEKLAPLKKWLAKRKNRFFRIGTGELSDSLSLDNHLGLAPVLIDFFKKIKNVQFELKTKSDNVDHLLEIKNIDNIVISFSVNPQKLIKKIEHGTASLEQRIVAARKAAKAGYRIAFHFDPIVVFPGWEREYRKVIKNIFSSVNPDSIQFISMGVMRYFKELKDQLFKRFPGSVILEGPFTRGPDNKWRYYRPIREDIFRKMKNWILESDPHQWIYFCMEGKNTWKDVFNLDIRGRKNLDPFFEKRRMGNLTSLYP